MGIIAECNLHLFSCLDLPFDGYRIVRGHYTGTEAIGIDPSQFSTKEKDQ